MKKILQSVIDKNKDNIGFVGTDSLGMTVIVDKNDKILYSCFLGKGKFVDYEDGKIAIYKDE